jgi:hypothetical protein
MLWNHKECRPLAKNIYTAIAQGRMKMTTEEFLTAPEIIGKENWSTLQENEQCFAFCFVSTAVRMGLLGLKQAGQDTRNLWLYRVD